MPYKNLLYTSLTPSLLHISNDSNVILKCFHFVLLVVFFYEPQFYTAHAQQRTTFVNYFSSSMIMRFTKINNTVRAIFIYLFIYLFIYALVSVFQLLTEF
jgi:hypothetical protein